MQYPSYPNGQFAAVSYGIIRRRFADKKYNFAHVCSTEFGSSGAPILSIVNNKVIGIHKKRESNNKDYNIGVFFHEIIIEFIKKFESKDETDKIKKIENYEQNKDSKKNEITIRYKKFYDDIKLFGKTFVQNNIDNCKIIYEGKEEKLCCYLSEIPSYRAIKFEKQFNPIIEIKLKVIKNIDSNRMFYGCTDLISLHDIDNFDEPFRFNNEVFCGCINLSYLPDMSRWIASCWWNFFCCSSLRELKIYSDTKLEELKSLYWYRCGTFKSVEYFP